jgi:hypothetical protein
VAKTLTFYRVPDLNRTLRTLPRTASANLRDASQTIAGHVAAAAATRARGLGGVAALVAPTIRASRDRVPVVKMGGSGRLPTAGDGWSRTRQGQRQTIGDVIWGAEFGSTEHRQFQPWGHGYFLWPTVEDSRQFIEDAYGDAILEAVDEAAR